MQNITLPIVIEKSKSGEWSTIWSLEQWLREHDLYDPRLNIEHLKKQKQTLERELIESRAANRALHDEIDKLKSDLANHEPRLEQLAGQGNFLFGWNGQDYFVQHADLIHQITFGLSLKEAVQNMIDAIEKFGPAWTVAAPTKELQKEFE